MTTSVPASSTKKSDDLVIHAVGFHTCRKLSPTEVLQVASIAPAESQDPVDVALRASLRQNRHDLYEHDGTPKVNLVPEEFEPATPERKYSIAKIRGIQVGEKVRDLAIMRGDVDDVLANATISRSERKIFIRDANMQHSRGRRSLAVAVANLNDDGTPGEFFVEGSLAMGLVHRDEAETLVQSNPSEWVRVHIWGASLRLQHWLNLFLMIVMTLTGYYIMEPYAALPDYNGAEAPFLMGWIRFAHFVSAFAWIAVGLWRFVFMFVTNDRQSRWRSFWPIYSTEDVKNLFGTVQHYLFLKKEGPIYFAHNPLQQFAYTGIYALCLVQWATGLALYGMYEQNNWFFALMSAPIHWIGIGYIRLIHAIIMYLIWAFAIIHVYLVFRSDAKHGHTGLSAMVGGWTWLRRGTEPVDAPRVG